MKEHINLYIKYALILLLVFLSILIVQPFFKVIILSMVLVYMAFPLQKFFNNKIKNKNLSAGIVTFCLLLIIIVPLIFASNTLLNEAVNIYNSAHIENLQETIQTQLHIEISAGVQSYIDSITKNAAAYIFTQISSFVFSLPNLIIDLFIMLGLVFYGLRDGEKLLAYFNSIIPIEEDYKRRFHKRLTTTLQALFYGNVAVAFLAAIAATIGFYFIGVSSPILLGFLVGITALLPWVGAAAVWAPLTIITYAQGNTGQATAIALFGFIVLSIFIDTFLRAKLMGLRANIHPVVMLIGVLGGLAAFGFIGMIIGPLVLSIFDLILEIYMETKDEAKS